MAGTFQPPPLYELPVLVDKATGMVRFSSNWLKWFVDLAAFLTKTGGATGTINHNTLDNLQGGGANQFYHLTAIQAAYAAGGYGTLPSAITVGSSPFTYQASSSHAEQIMVSGGTVSAIEFSRDNTTFYVIGQVSGPVMLAPSDRLRVTYSGLPTLIKVLM